MTKPAKKFECGGISVAVWANEIQTDAGPRTVERVTLERRYKDATTGEWKSTNGFRENEIPRAILLLSKAYEALALGRKNRGDEDDGAAWPGA